MRQEQEASGAIRPVSRSDAATDQHSLVNKATLIMLSTLLSSGLGMLRLLVTNALFSQTAAGTYFAALKLPQFLSDLLVGGAVSAALIPTFVTEGQADHRRGAHALSIVLRATAVLLGLATLILWVGAGWFVAALNPGFTLPNRTATTALLRISALALPLGGFSAVLGAWLAAARRQQLTALAAGALHLGVCVTALTLGARLGVRALALGLVLGSAAQAALLWWQTRRRPGLPTIDTTPATPSAQRAILWRIVWLYAPVAAGMLIGILIQAVDQSLQSQTYDQATHSFGGPNIAALASATALIQFPVGLVAAALAFAALPDLARATNDPTRFATITRMSTRLGIFLMTPVMVLYLTSATPIVALLFQHHAFGATDTARTALALRAYAAELPAIAVEQVGIAACYARRQPYLPVLATLIGGGAYLLVALPNYRTVGMPALAMANAAQHIATALCLMVMLNWRIHGIWDRPILGTLIRSGCAGILMAALTSRCADLPHATLPEQIVALVVPVAVGILTYLAASLAFNAPELALLGHVGDARRRRSGSTPG